MPVALESERFRPIGPSHHARHHLRARDTGQHLAPLRGDPWVMPLTYPMLGMPHWLTAQRSAIIQTSPVHMGRCGGDLGYTLEHLMNRMVRLPVRSG